MFRALPSALAPGSYFSTRGERRSRPRMRTPASASSAAHAAHSPGAEPGRRASPSRTAISALVQLARPRRHRHRILLLSRERPRSRVNLHAQDVPPVRNYRDRQTAGELRLAVAVFRRVAVWLLLEMQREPPKSSVVELEPKPRRRLIGSRDGWAITRVHRVDLDDLLVRPRIRGRDCRGSVANRSSWNDSVAVLAAFVPATCRRWRTGPSCCAVACRPV